MDAKRFNHIPCAPLTGGPYAQAVVHNGLVYVAGQIPWDSASQKLFVGDVAAETRNVFDNLRVILKACGSDLDHVLRVTVLLTDSTAAKEFSAAYKAIFKPDCLPVRTMVFVTGLPLGASIELEVTAALSPSA